MYYFLSFYVQDFSKDFLSKLIGMKLLKRFLNFSSEFQLPFLHESLLLEREEGLSEEEKLEAQMLYEKEKNCYKGVDFERDFKTSKWVRERESIEPTFLDLEKSSYQAALLLVPNVLQILIFFPFFFLFWIVGLVSICNSLMLIL